MATNSSLLAWKISWTEELAGRSPRGHKESDVTEHPHYVWLTTIKNTFLRIQR